ncbi:MAG: glutaminase domain-containing protein [Planctomycetota bacterium JB042]
MISSVLLLSLLSPFAAALPNGPDGDRPADAAAVGERLGRARALTRPLPGALRREHPALQTAREGRKFGYRIEVPRGTYGVEIGLPELLYEKAGARRFSVRINGKPVVESIDLVEAAGPAPSVKVVRVEAKAFDNGLNVWFEAERLDAAAAWIAVEGNGRSLFVDCGGERDLPSESEESGLGEVILARFGSRFLLDLRPQWGDVETSAFGKFHEPPQPAILGFRTGAGRFVLPVAGAAEGTAPFDEVVERRTATSVAYDVRFDGLEGTITLRAPFVPGDLMLASLPAIHVEFAVRRPAAAPPRVVDVELFLPAADAQAKLVGRVDEPFRGVAARRERPLGVETFGLFVGDPDGPPSPWTTRANFGATPGGIVASVPLLLERKKAAVEIVYAAHVAGAVLEVHGEPMRHRYAARHANVIEVAQEAARRRGEAFAASDVVDGLLDGLPAAFGELWAHALPSFLMNTYRAESAEGDVWFSCLEGYCRFHSTIDVEYNAAPFYVWFAPHLLRELLVAWTRFEREEGFLAHDMGKDALVGAQAYSHDMPVEENTNYVLLLLQYWTATGDDAFVRERFPLVSRLLAFVERSDADGDGFPETGVANTIDDASPAVQFAREQTYLAVKAAAAFAAGAEMADLAGDAAAAERWRARVAATRATLDEEAWRGDHYAVGIDAASAGLVDPWAKRTLAEPVVDGVDSAHSYTGVGLAYLLRAGLPLPVDEARIRQDLRVAAARCERRFGYAHAEHEENVWISQNLFRDAVAVGLGDDVLDRVSRYAALQEVRARAPDVPNWAGFCDSPYNRHLSYYPRGVALLALVDAAGGVALDRRKGTLLLRPIRAPLRVPIAALADWSANRVPWLEVEAGDDGAPEARVTRPELLRGLEVTIDLSRVGGGVRKL